MGRQKPKRRFWRGERARAGQRQGKGKARAKAGKVKMR